MSRINSRTKGASGEREFCNWLYENFDLPERPVRNLEQVRSGGVDIICPPFAFEVKRCQTLDFIAWWHQVRQAVKHGPALGLEPVVAFRQNKQDWEFLISSRFIGVEVGYIHMKKAVFKKWALRYVEIFNEEKRQRGESGIQALQSGRFIQQDSWPAV